MFPVRLNASPRFALAILAIATICGIAGAPVPGQANPARVAVEHAIGSFVQHADANIESLESQIEAQIKKTDFNPLTTNLERAGTIREKIAAIEKIQDKMGTVSVGISNYLMPVLPQDAPTHKVDPEHRDPAGSFGGLSQGIKDRRQNIEILKAYYQALLVWQKLRAEFADYYEDFTGRAYQVSQAPAGVVCDEDEFAFNSVAVSTNFSKAVMPVERDFAANRPLQPGDLQIAVLTDVQQNPVGEASTGPSGKLNLAQVNGNGTPPAGGQSVGIRIGGAIRTGGSDRSDPSSLSEDEIFGALNNWVRGAAKPKSGPTAADSEPLTDAELGGIYIDCTKFNTGLPYGETRYISPNISGFELGHSYVPSGEMDGGVAKSTTGCHETANNGLSDLQDGVLSFSRYPFRIGGFYSLDLVGSLAIARLGAEELARHGVRVDPNEATVTQLDGQRLYGTVTYPNFEFEGGGCSSDASDIQLSDGWSTLQYRQINPATRAQLSAGGLQVAALPERLPEDRLQVAAKADQALPNDFHFHAKGNVRKGTDDQWALKAIGFKAVGRNGKGSLWPKRATPVLVAVVDTGLDPTHPDIAGAIYANPKETPGNGKDDDKNGFVDDVFGWNFVDDSNNTWDNNGHGTFVAGIIAARTDDKIGIAGVNPWARILPVKVSEFDGMGENFNLAHGIHYAAKMGARVINVSIGGRKLTVPERYAIEFAEERGALVIVAAGNDGIDVSDYSPAGIPGAITVAATDRENKRGRFSNFGAAVDIAAPGVEVLSLRARQTDVMVQADKDYVPGSNIVGTGGLYYHLSGTSFSAPFVAGVASLLFSINQDLTPAQVKRMILQSARDIEDPGFDWLTGYGMLDAAAAIKADPAFFVDARLTDVGLVERNGQSFLQPVGTAVSDKFKRAWIEVGQGKSPKKWVKASAEMNKGVTDGALALVGVQHFTGGGDWTLKLVVEHRDGRRREARYSLALE